MAADVTNRRHQLRSYVYTPKNTKQKLYILRSNYQFTRNREIRETCSASPWRSNQQSPDCGKSYRLNGLCAQQRECKEKRCGENTQIKRPKRYMCFLKNTKLNYSVWNADLGDEHKEKQRVVSMKVRTASPGGKGRGGRAVWAGHQSFIC